MQPPPSSGDMDVRGPIDKGQDIISASTTVSPPDNETCCGIWARCSYGAPYAVYTLERIGPILFEEEVRNQ
jgi:hypothetical protein